MNGTYGTLALRSANVARAGKLHRALLSLCIVYASLSTFSRVGIFDLANKAIMALFCCLVFVLFCWEQQSHGTYLILAITALAHVIAFAFPISPFEGIATYFMFAFWILFWLYLVRNIDTFLENVREMRHVLHVVLVSWCVVVFVSLFLPFCYKLGWGGERYFTSFTTDSFEIAPVAMFMLAVDIILYRMEGGDARALALSVVPMTCVFAAGTRTYLIVVCIEFALLLRMMIKGNGTYFLVLCVFALVAFSLASVTNIGAKFASSTFDTGEIKVFLEVFTNGRSEFWPADWNAFLQSDWFCRLFGHGFSFVYELNQHVVGARLYAHNDFINVLLNFGLIGMGLYLCAFVPAVKLLWGRGGRVPCLLFVFMWLFNAFFNMIYVYAVAVIATGILCAALSYRTEGMSGA